MRRGAAVLLLLVLGFPPAAFASRTAQEGRALPRLLSEDVSLVRFLPGVVAGRDRFFLVDVTNSSASNLALAPREGTDDLAAVILGRGTHVGYVLDGSTHNLVVTGRAGWGVVLGVSDGYTRDLYDSADTSRVYTEFRKSELSRRLARLGGGWTMGPAGGRRVSVGLGVTYLDVDYSSEIDLVVGTLSRTFEGGWRSNPGLGFDVTFQALSPNPGLQMGGRFSLENLNEESSIPTGLPLRRRYATLEAGWRVDTRAVDDLMVGITTSWTTESTAEIHGGSSYQTLRVTETTQYYGAVFFSAEHEVRDGLRLRGGVLGPARFLEAKRDETREEDEGNLVMIVNEDSNGVVDSPQVALGGSWTWKAWLLELQVNKSLNTDAPVVRWAATLAY